MDPFTIAAGISALGGVFKGLTGFFGGNAQAQAERNAALQAQMQGGVNAGLALQQGDAVAAHGAVTAAANGGGFVGSSLGVIQNLSQQAMYNARQQVYRAQTEAQAHLYAGQVDSMNARNALIGGAVDAGSSLVGGFARSALFKQQLGLWSTLRGLGADTPYDMAGAF